ncbi:hypothetical protein Tco_0200415 [Tanacetum coccineum]
MKTIQTLSRYGLYTRHKVHGEHGRGISLNQKAMNWYHSDRMSLDALVRIRSSILGSGVTVIHCQFVQFPANDAHPERPIFRLYKWTGAPKVRELGLFMKLCLCSTSLEIKMTKSVALVAFGSTRVQHSKFNLACYCAVALCCKLTHLFQTTELHSIALQLNTILGTATTHPWLAQDVQDLLRSMLPLSSTI